VFKSSYGALVELIQNSSPYVMTTDNEKAPSWVLLTSKSDPEFYFTVKING
jgi:hypothetical protein